MNNAATPTTHGTRNASLAIEDLFVSLSFRLFARGTAHSTGFISEAFARSARVRETHARNQRSGCASKYDCKMSVAAAASSAPLGDG